ncbi:MAG: Type II cytosine-specific DNA methyltransferase [uncultured Sulfurovum sp.]|uniref:Type II cytosine-specific DNA methyltransferase n=1 Tax=uncultured Sulfurovum sp. TaxID=269237 RepID=A0A6S6SWG2_9BACT|nr:MAG: Type II cytosine-specific DNA methyltransferase [uncultured Sulfurovum sp.]
MSVLNINIPDVATKKLKLQSISQGRKLVVSTNWLPLFGFNENSKVVEKVIGKNEGMEILLFSDSLFGCENERTKKVYSRSYKSRKSNPIETLLDIRSQNKINEAFGSSSYVHITFEYGKIYIVPIEDKKEARIKKAKEREGKIGAFVACSSGMDALSISKSFNIDCLLEYRPHERRDKNTDKSETGALCAISNVEVGHLINEDIFTVDMDMIGNIVKKKNTSFFSVSTQCSDLSVVKAQSLKEKSLCVNGDGSIDTTIDMFYDVLRILESTQMPFLLLENVGQLLNTQYHTFFKARLNRWGYKVYEKNIDASMLGATQKRKRAYVFATTFDSIPFSFPEERDNQITSVEFWDKNIKPFLHECRDVTHSKSIQEGAKIGRLRTVNRESRHFPTLLKSQSRMAKDSLVIKDGERYYFPSEDLERHIMGIPDEFTLAAVSKTIGSEILGQGVEYCSHHKIIDEVYKHITLALLA